MNIEPKSDRSDTNYSRTVCGGVKKQKATALLTLVFAAKDGIFFASAGCFTFSKCAFIFLNWMKKTMQRRMRAITTTPRATIIGVPGFPDELLSTIESVCL